MKNKKILIVIIIIVLVGSFCFIVFNSLDKNKISFRDTNDNLLMNGDVLVNKNPAKVGKDSAGNPVVFLKIKDTDVFYEVTEKVSHQNDNRMVIWLNFDEKKDSFKKEKENCENFEISHCLSIATVVSGMNNNEIMITGSFDDDKAEKLVKKINQK